MADNGFDELADLALRKSGQAFKQSQQYLMEARLSHILRRENFSTLSELADCLQARPNPVFEDEVVAALTSKSTAFFQDREALAYIVNTFLPQAAKANEERGEKTPLRILCAGGGTGQEAYSLAILLDELDLDDLPDQEIELVSLDICRASTERAAAGRYGHFEIQTGLSVHRMLKYFHREDDQWVISDDMRERISFQVGNLMEPMSDFATFDIILCRNVMSNMALSLARDLTGRLARMLTPDGLLFLSAHETLHSEGTDLRSSSEAPHALCLSTRAEKNGLVSQPGSGFDRQADHGGLRA